MTSGTANEFTVEGFRAYLAAHANDVFGRGDERLCPVAAYVCSVYPGSLVGASTVSTPPAEHTKRRTCRNMPRWARHFVATWDKRSMPLTGKKVLGLLNRLSERRAA